MSYISSKYCLAGGRAADSTLSSMLFVCSLQSFNYVKVTTIVVGLSRSYNCFMGNRKHYLHQILRLLDVYIKNSLSITVCIYN